MTPRQTIYIAGPYGDTDPAVRAEHIRRVAVLSSHLVREGYAPVSVHAAIESGAFGNDFDPEERAMGLQAATAIACQCDRMFVILRDDETMSDGTKREVDAYLEHATGDVMPGTWAWWCEQVLMVSV